MFQFLLPKVHLWTESHDSELKLLSCRFSPPQVDFEEASMLDARTRWIRKSKHHLSIDDIALVELERFYDFCYMQPGDLVFYLYSVFSAYMVDTTIDTSDCFLYSFDHLLPKILHMLDEKENELVRQAFQVMYECNWQAYGSDSTEGNEQGLYIQIGSDLDVEQCPNMLKFLNICKMPRLIFPEPWDIKS